MTDTSAGTGAASLMLRKSLMTRYKKHPASGKLPLAGNNFLRIIAVKEEFFVCNNLIAVISYQGSEKTEVFLLHKNKRTILQMLSKPAK